jgi:hypothetical protein
VSKPLTYTWTSLHRFKETQAFSYTYGELRAAFDQITTIQSAITRERNAVSWGTPLWTGQRVRRCQHSSIESMPYASPPTRMPKMTVYNRLGATSLKVERGPASSKCLPAKAT